MTRPLDDNLEACAKAALAADFSPVPWETAPKWRQAACIAVANACLDTANPDQVRCAWTTEMVNQGFRWSQEFDEAQKTHPGIVFGELTRGGTKHWLAVIEAVREVGKARGVRMLGA